MNDAKPVISNCGCFPLKEKAELTSSRLYASSTFGSTMRGLPNIPSFEKFTGENCFVLELITDQKSHS